MNNKDWRLANQINYLRKKRLQRMSFEPYNAGWEHEHCEFCSERIDAEKSAYTTDDKYYWICEECFNDFKDMFEWTLI